MLFGFRGWEWGHMLKYISQLRVLSGQRTLNSSLFQSSVVQSPLPWLLSCSFPSPGISLALVFCSSSFVFVCVHSLVSLLSSCRLTSWLWRRSCPVSRKWAATKGNASQRFSTGWWGTWASSAPSSETETSGWWVRRKFQFWISCLWQNWYKTHDVGDEMRDIFHISQCCKLLYLNIWIPTFPVNPDHKYFGTSETISIKTIILSHQIYIWLSYHVADAWKNTRLLLTSLRNPSLKAHCAECVSWCF